MPGGGFVIGLSAGLLAPFIGLGWVLCSPPLESPAVLASLHVLGAAHL